MRGLLAALRSPAVRTGFLLIALAGGVWAVVSRWEEIVQALSAMSLAPVVGAGLCSLVYVVLTMAAWRALLADMGTPLAARPALAVFFVSQLGKYLPGGVWNILAAAELGADHRIPRRRSVSVMTVSLAVSIATGLALAAATLPFAPWQTAATYSWAVLTLPVLLVILAPPVLNRLLALALRVVRRPALEHPISWRGLLVCTAWTLLAWGVAGVQVWLLAISTGMMASPATAMLCIGGYAMAWSVGFLIVFVPAGAGVRETVLALVLAGSLSGGGAVTVVLLSRVLLTAADLGLGGFGVLLSRSGRDSDEARD